MVIKPGEVLNPVGNPNIRSIRKTGPTTIEGKFKNAIRMGVFGTGEYSTLLTKVRKCAVCPLGQKTQKYFVNGKEMIKSIPAKCSFYMAPETENGEKCVIPVADFLKKSKMYYAIMKADDTLELQKSLIQQSILDAEVNRESDLVEKGKPGFMAKEFQEQALKYTTELNKIKYQQIQKHLHAHISEENVEKEVEDIKLEDEK